jgi:hypothetical protein
VTDIVMSPELDKVSMVLVGYKRPKELFTIMGIVADFPWVDEVIVYENSDESNIGVLGRYRAAEKARNSIIATQDDDNIVLNWDLIRRSWDGKHLSNARKRNYVNQQWGNGYETFVAQGGLFRKEWISVLDEYINIYGEDEVLFNQADRIFAALLRRPHNTIEAQIDEFDAASDPASAMYLQPGYWDRLNQAEERVNTLMRKIH